MGGDNDYIVARAEREDAQDERPGAAADGAEDARAAEKERVNRFCEELSASLSDYADGLTSTVEETACARKLRDELSPYAVTRLEAFRTSPYAGRNCCGLLGAVYALAAVFYFVSFGGSRADGVILVLVALGIFVCGGVAAGAAFLGAEKAVKCLYPKKVSYNVFSENMPLKKQQGNKLVVIASNHDASPGSYFVNFSLVRKVVFTVVPVSAVLFVMFCLVKIFVGSDTVAKITSLSVIPFINALAGISALVLHFSPFQRHARENNGVATSVSAAVYRRLLASPELLPEGTRVCFVSFGGENSAHAGSRAFAAAHPETKGALALVIGDIQSSATALVKKDALRGIEFSHSAQEALFGAVEDTGVPCLLPPCDGLKSKLNALHGYSADALAGTGCECAVFVAKDYGGKGEDFRSKDASGLFELALGTIVKMAWQREERGND